MRYNPFSKKKTVLVNHNREVNSTDDAVPVITEVLPDSGANSSVETL